MNPRSTPVPFRRLLLVTAASCSFAPGLRAQPPTPAPVINGAAASTTTTPAAVPSNRAQLNNAQLETLLGPIALYPDALIAVILPAATSPSDVVLAARYLGANRDPAQVDVQPWDESVRSLAHYPEVVKWMDENLSWTKQVGETFVAQPADVMQAVQRLRTLARAAGTLVDTQQQRVVSQGEILLIEPAQPNIIYVPRYDPDVVYITRSPGWNQPYVSFGVGFAVGSWLAYDCDWPGRTIWIGDWRRQQSRTVWVRPAFPDRPLHPGTPFPVARPWHPPEHRYGQPRVIGARPPTVIMPPQLMPGTPPRPFDGNYPPRRFDPSEPPRVRRPVTPGTPSDTFTPPPVFLPPAHTVGAPPPDDRRRDRTDPTPDRPRPETRRTPSTVNAPPAVGAPPEINPAPSHRVSGPSPERGQNRPDRPDRPERSNDTHREPRANTPGTPPPPPAPPPKPPAERNADPQLP